ncbi:MAG: Com family DNA-binding transcriptional regulator [Desulfovibrionaceae bacterium]|nr:Com family DNA-binding transcriptional regulator [Desulfovibrionaceae bacterium]
MKELKEIRCGHCNKLLGKGSAHDLEIKCTRCGTLNHVRDTSPCSEPYEGQNGASHAYSAEKIGK